MRALKVPPRGPIPAEVNQGQPIFEKIGCTDCHVETMTTAPAGTAIHGGAYVLSAAIGGKQFHPFGDFLLHDVGTGDGNVENGPPDTQYKVRTMPLWGLRTRTQFMHDASVGSYSEAIARHRVEAADDVSQSGSENAASSIPWIAIGGAPKKWVFVNCKGGSEKSNRPLLFAEVRVVF